MQDTLLEIAKRFNQKDIFWAVGGSLMLQHYHLLNNPKDIDIIVSIDDIDKANDILVSLAKRKVQTNKKEYATQYFYEYETPLVNIDLMAGFAIIHSQGQYVYPFDEHSITTFSCEAINIHYYSLEDWYILYQLMPNREEKVVLICDYFKHHTIKAPLLLTRSLDQKLPQSVQENVLYLLQLEPHKL